MVGVMRWIEFIGYALDQAGLRSDIKKGIGMLWDWSNARWIVRGSEPRCSRERRSIRSRCAGAEALGYDFPLIIDVIDSWRVG